jgi:hypothetical protein
MELVHDMSKFTVTVHLSICRLVKLFCLFFFPDTRQTNEYLRILTRPTRKQLGIEIERVGERGKKHLPGWRGIFHFYSPSLNCTRYWRVGEWFSAFLLRICNLITGAVI